MALNGNKVTTMMKRSLVTTLLIVIIRLAPIRESEDLRGCVTEDLEASNSYNTLAWEAFLLNHIMMVIMVMLMMLIMVMTTMTMMMMMYTFLPQ